MEDGRIIDLFLQRDESAIRQTAEKYGSRLRALSLHITADAQTAEECENDTYLEAWSRIPPHEPRDYFYAFLARITRNVSIDRCRKRTALRRDAAVVELTDELAACLPAVDGVESVADAQALGDAISRFLRTLSREKRVIFLRRYFYLDTVAAISQRMGIGESKVKTVLFRIRRDLRTYLITEGYTP